MYKSQHKDQRTQSFQPGVCGPLVVRDGIAGGPRHEPMLISSPLIFIYFYKFALIFQHISRLHLNIVKNIEEITLTSAIGGICARGEGVCRQRLVIYSDNFTYFSVIGRTCVRGEGTWRQQLQTGKRRVWDCKMFWESLAHQWAADYFLVRMVVPGTKPVENPWNRGSFVRQWQINWHQLNSDQ